MGEYTIQEMLSQPEVWRRTLEVMRGADSPLAEFDRLLGDAPLMFTGCGSSWFLSHVSAAVLNRYAGGRAYAVSATDITTYPECLFTGGVVPKVIAVSRSGKPMETTAAARYLKQVRHWPVLGVCCVPGSPLIEFCDSTLFLEFAAEKSRFMSRALTAMILTFELLAARRSGDKAFEDELQRLPDLLNGLLTRYRATIEDRARSAKFTKFTFLGQGPYYGLAAESMLKIKEMAAVPAEFYQGFEYMHGPRYAADGSTLITVLLSDGGGREQLELLPKLKALGAQVSVICERATPEVTANADFVLELNSGLSDYGRLLLMMPLTQLFGFYHACSLGKNID